MYIKKPTFSGHESFPFRHTWLPRGVQWCEMHDDFSQVDEIMAQFGLGKNMVRSMKHWCFATQLIEQNPDAPTTKRTQLRASDIGYFLFIGDKKTPPYDPYLEDIGSLWLIHWLLATNATGATTYYYAFNLYNRPEFTRSSLEKEVVEFSERHPSSRVSPKTIGRDVEVFIRSYAMPRKTEAKILEETLGCPLIELDLVSPLSESGTYAFNRSPKDTLPPEIFAYTVGAFIRASGGEKTLSFDDLCFAPGSPGRVFKLDEFSLAVRLEGLDELTKGAWNFVETAGLKQLVVMGDDYDEYKQLHGYFNRSLKALAV